MIIVTHFSQTVKQYAQAAASPGREKPLPERCPHAECQGEQTLIRWGSYERWLLTGAEDLRVKIQRLRCKRCGRTHSLLPDFIHPYRHYGLSLLQQVMGLYLVLGLSYEQLQRRMPEQGPAAVTVREWVEAFSYGAGHLLLGALLRSLLLLSREFPEPEPEPAHLQRRRPAQRRIWLKGARQFWSLAEQLYAQVKTRQARLQFAAADLLRFVLHWLSGQGLTPRLFWSPRLPTTPSSPL